jgi:hypothetical protein
VGYNTYVHGNNTRNLPASDPYLKLVKKPCFSYVFFLNKIGEQEGGTGFSNNVYHVSKGRNNKIKF